MISSVNNQPHKSLSERAVKAGHRVVMTPGKFCYLDSYQDAPQFQPEASGGYLPLANVYSYDPASPAFTEEEAKLIYGVQGNLWAEYIPTSHGKNTSGFTT